MARMLADSAASLLGSCRQAHPHTAINTMSHLWRCRDRTIAFGPRALIMGIVNVTPDSFSDGGQHNSTDQAIAHASKLLADGADILDIGGESSRPGAGPVSLEEEHRRVIPVVAELSKLTSIPISVDTIKAPIAREALRAGACIINDITALRGDPDMVRVVAEHRAGLVLMHMRGDPATMQLNPVYDDIIADIEAFFEERLDFARCHGLEENTIALDPGIGFGKSFEHTLLQLRGLAKYQRLGRPVCLGVSRKGFIGMILGRPREQRVIGSVAVACHAIIHGGAQIVRVHDVAEHRDAARMLEALTGEGLRGTSSGTR